MKTKNKNKSLILLSILFLISFSYGAYANETQNNELCCILFYFEEYSENIQVNYIGHSNGCRVALSSLNEYSDGKGDVGFAFSSETGQYDILMDLPTNPVDKFFGIACPATLNDETLFTEAARNEFPFTDVKKGEWSIAINRWLNKKHIGWDEYARFLAPYNLIDDAYLLSIFVGSDKISMNLMEFYNDLAIEESSTFDVSDVDVNNLYLHNGFETDLIVHFNDQTRIIDSSNLAIQDELGFQYDSIKHLENHVFIKNNPEVKKEIKTRLRE